MRPEAIRRIVLQEWRGLPGEPPPDKRCKKLSESLAVLLPKLGLADRVDEEEMRAAWRDIVGDFLAAHSRPDSLRAGVLTVSVLQPSVRYELETSWKTKILAKLQQRFGRGKVRALSFR